MAKSLVSWTVAVMFQFAVCVRACVRACVRVCVRACARVNAQLLNTLNIY